MSSNERKALIRVKMKASGLEEGSSVLGGSYEEDELWDLSQITSGFAEIQKK